MLTCLFNYCLLKIYVYIPFILYVLICYACIIFRTTSINFNLTLAGILVRVMYLCVPSKSDKSTGMDQTKSQSCCETGVLVMKSMYGPDSHKVAASQVCLW